MIREVGQLTLHVVSHTHWDREWYMSFETTRWRLVKLIDRLLDMLEREPAFHSFMLDGQTCAIRDYLELRPHGRARLERQIAGERLLVGPWYSQPNEFMVSGESLIRNLELGLEEAGSLGGAMRIAYLPDAFGHVSQLPQIVAGFRISHVVAYRGHPADAGMLFRWRGPEGTEVTVCTLIGGYASFVAVPRQSEDGVRYRGATPIAVESLPRRLDRMLETMRRRSSAEDVLCMNGNDHAFAQDDLPIALEAIRRHWPSISVIHTNLASFLAVAEGGLRDRGQTMATYTGELRDPTDAPILPGSQSTRYPVKAANRRCEDLLERWVEPFATFAWLTGARYPHEAIRLAWRELLTVQCHDTLCGSSLDVVADLALARLETVKQLGTEILDESLELIARHVCAGGGASGEPSTGQPADTATFIVFNPLTMSRTEIVDTIIEVPAVLPIEEPAVFDGGRQLRCATTCLGPVVALRPNSRFGSPDAVGVTRHRISFEAEAVPALGFRVYRLGNPVGRTSVHGLARSSRSAENAATRLVINPDGTLDVTHLGTGRTYRGLNYFEDSGEAGNGFLHVAPVTDSIITSRGGTATISVLEDTPVRVSFLVTITLSLPTGISDDRERRRSSVRTCAIESVVSLDCLSPRVTIQTTVDNTCADHRLRVGFPSRLASDHSCAEQPFDVVRRPVATPQGRPGGVEEPSPTHPQLSFVDVSDGSVGLMIANDGLGEYEVTDDEDRSILLTLLRCTDVLYEPPFDAVDVRIPGAQCIGRHVFRYAIIPHRYAWQQARAEAYRFRFPMRAVMRSDPEEPRAPADRSPPDGAVPAARDEGPERRHSPPALAGSLLHVSPPDIDASAIRTHPDRDSLTVRLFNPTDATVLATVRIGCARGPCTGARLLTLGGRTISELGIDRSGGVSIEIAARALATVELSTPGAPPFSP